VGLGEARAKLKSSLYAWSAAGLLTPASTSGGNSTRKTLFSLLRHGWHPVGFGLRRRFATRPASSADRVRHARREKRDILLGARMSYESQRLNGYGFSTASLPATQAAECVMDEGARPRSGHSPRVFRRGRLARTTAAANWASFWAASYSAAPCAMFGWVGECCQPRYKSRSSEDG
jgi:hypothetical protein